MKEHFQDYGIRKWAGNDLIELQSEPLEALQKLVEPYAPCIIQGCEVTKNEGENGTSTITVEPGLVALQGKDYKGEDCVKIARFAGIADKEPPVYLTLECEPDKRVYGDSKSKAIAYHYRAVATTQKPEGPYLKIAADDNKRLVDTLGITQKLDREGGNASDVKVVSFTTDTAQDRTNITPGMTLKEIFGKIYRWLSELKAMAFKAQVAKSDLAFDLDDELGKKVDKIEGKGLVSVDSQLDATSENPVQNKLVKEALDGKVDNTVAGMNGAINLLGESSVTPQDNDFYISQYVNGGTSNKTYLRRRMSALWAYIKGKLSSDTGVNINGNAASATKATQDSDGNVIKDTYAKKTSIPTGVWRSNNGGKNSASATTTLTAKQTCTFTLKWRVSSESNCDKLTITAAGTTLVSAVSGEKNGIVTETSIASGAAIALTYTKDSSTNTGRDLGEISDFYITVGGVLVAITPFNIDTYFTVTHGVYFFGPVLNITAATANLPGLMSAADKTKLDGIATGANNYTHPTTAGNKHIPNYGSSGQYLKYSAQGTAAWASPASNLATTSAAGFMSADDKNKLKNCLNIYYIGYINADGTHEKIAGSIDIKTSKIASGYHVSGMGNETKGTFIITNTTENSVTIEVNRLISNGTAYIKVKDTSGNVKYSPVMFMVIGN